MFAATLPPNQAQAFWPFSTNADAAANTLIPSASTPVLVASINRNPSASAPIALATSGGAALIAYGGPSGTAANVASAPAPERVSTISVYVVRAGDTLSDIAGMFDVSINTIVWANDLKSARDVRPGDTLIILPISGIEHTIKKGDTLKSLAKKYSADAEEIALFNGLDASEPLAVGSNIIVPGGEIAPPAPVQSGPSVHGVREPARGGGGVYLPGYFSNPVPNGILTQKLHGWNGIDLGAPRGTPVYAAADGIVIVSRGGGGWNGGYGNYVVITHGNGAQTLYSHLKNTAVSPGQFVSKGALIGTVGTTGRVTGPHLHFEVRGAANPLRTCSVGSSCQAQ